jgi:hypothetical protein
MTMLSFSTTEDHLEIRGKTMYIKESLKMVGGQWHGTYWTLPIFLDGEDLREAILRDAAAARKLRRKKLRASCV